MSLNEDNSYLCDACGGIGRIPFDRISLTNKPDPIRVNPPSREAWLKERRGVDVKPWLEELLKAEGPADLTEAVLVLAARVQYLEEIVYDKIIQEKGE